MSSLGWQGYSVISRADSPFVPPPVLAAGEREFPLLWGVDPHGTAVFNQRQMIFIQAELRTLAAIQALSNEERKGFAEMQRLCMIGLTAPNSLLFVLGD